MTMRSEDIHSTLSTTTTLTTLAPPPASETCILGKKHASTPPPPIPARSSRRPISAVLKNGIKLFKGTEDEGNIVLSAEGKDATRDSSRMEMEATRPEKSSAINETSDINDANDANESVSNASESKPRIGKQRKGRVTAVVDDIDREASNVSEIIEDRLYFMWTSINPISTRRTTYLTVDKYLQYQAFHADFGPFDIADVFRFCCLMKERLELAQKQGRVLCLHTKPEDNKRANAAFALCCYMMLLHNKKPEEAYAPLEFIHPPIEPYRDAGCGPSTFSLSILDCLRGLHKGLDLGLLRLDQFDVKEYEFYENPCNGDFNWITPSFIAFAAPVDSLTYEAQVEAILLGAASSSETESSESLSSESSSSESTTRSATPSSIHSSSSTRISTPSTQSIEPTEVTDEEKKSIGLMPGTTHVAPTPQLCLAMENVSKINEKGIHTDLDKSDLSLGTKMATGARTEAGNETEARSATKKSPKRPCTRLKKSFRNILEYFEAHNVKAVIRLNDKTYDETHFRNRGMKHYDLQYPDGSCPPWHIVQEFMNICQEMIDHKQGVVAVHCMAGLGRTGTLIGVYLMREYDMTARETIAFLRLMRPGSVVGPQQNWLVENERHIRQKSWDQRQEQLRLQMFLQHQKAGNVHDSGYPRTEIHRNGSRTVSTMATPATDYEQVFSRANSEGFEALGSEGEVDDGAMEVVEDSGDESGAGNEKEEALYMEENTDLEAMTAENDSMSENNDDNDGNGPSAGWDISPPMSVYEPAPLSHLRETSRSSLESLAEGFDRGSVSGRAGVETAMSSADEDMERSPTREHIGDKDYAIPLQPRKQQPLQQQQQQQQQHRHHHHRRRNSSNRSMSPTTSPAVSAMSSPSSVGSFSGVAQQRNASHLDALFSSSGSFPAHTLLFDNKSAQVNNDNPKSLPSFNIGTGVDVDGMPPLPIPFENKDGKSLHGSPSNPKTCSHPN
ncbi:Dual specificity protein phosphatase cdc14a [Mortierella sp. GBA30]|nr:Dual specificity protein phosphatase cdc14a [Mortierella sp. GBA30]